MDGASLNQYEEQLYSMFKSFDVNNEEALDEPAVNALCDALQLEERGAALVDTLFHSHTGRVSFAAFRSGLLTVLGDERPAHTPRPPDPDPDPEPGVLFGSKRYGRRSRPAAPALAPHERAASASRLDARPSPGRRARRSTSALEPRAGAAPPPPALAHDARLDSEAALALCRDLRMDTVDRDLVDRIFEESPTVDTTVGEFFERLDSTLARDLRGAAESRGPRHDDERLDAERLLEEWEAAGVPRPRRLLAELGFPAAGAALDPERLERALDEELRARAEAAPPDPISTATLALARMRAAAARALAAAAAAERDKLRGDVAAANARAGLLARDVDESHARIEAELRESVRRAEARHAEEARRARAAADAELERCGAERTRLAGEVARRGDAEARLRADAEEARRRIAELEERAAEAAAALEAGGAERARLADRLADAERRECVAEAEAAEARAHLAAATREVRRLQDRADELAHALEATRAARPARPAAPVPAPDGNLSAELASSVEGGGGGGWGRADAGSQTDGSGAGAAAGAEALEEERDRLQELVKELEGGLEAMRVEYEACEEYWAGKQREERRAHDAELRAADARLGDLVARVGDFERRLRPPAPLPPIPEAPLLEAQVCALEADAAEARREARDADARLQRAHRRLAALQRRRAPAPAAAGPGCGGGGGGAEARARAAHAEAAARQLHARLLTAELLIKELFVENCNLARHPPP